MSKEPVNIVVLGASFAGLSAAHNFLRKTVDELGITRTAPRYRVVLVSPSTHLYWNIGAPRAIVSSSLIPHSKSFVPIIDAFRTYPKNRFTFIHGSAIAVDFNQKSVTIGIIGEISSPILGTNARWSSGADKRDKGEPDRQTTQIIPYHALILATGTSTDSPLLSLHGPHEQTITALDTFHTRLRDATTIIIAGGGASGVECAGQLATYINGGKRPKRSTSTPRSPASATFSTPEGKQQHKLLSLLGGGKKSRPNSKATDASAAASNEKKLIILLSGSRHLLPRLPRSVGDKAEKKLKKMGVNVIHSLRLLSAQELPSGSTRCILSDDLSMQCDLFIAATGVHPNTQFLPAELLDAGGYISADPQYLRVSRAGDRVYAIGDCASFSKNNITDVYDSIPVLMHNLKNDLLAYELKTHYPFGGAKEQLERLEDMRYLQNPKTTQLLPITKFGGVGVVLGHSIPGFLVYLMKGKTYRFSEAKSAARAGYNPYAPDTYVHK